MRRGKQHAGRLGVVARRRCLDESCCVIAAGMRWGWEEKEVTKQHNFNYTDLFVFQFGAPSVVEIMRGWKDEWMLKERGEAALDYLNFQRMLIIISLIINGFSLFFWTLNFLLQL